MFSHTDPYVCILNFTRVYTFSFRSFIFTADNVVLHVGAKIFLVTKFLDNQRFDDARRSSAMYRVHRRARDRFTGGVFRLTKTKRKTNAVTGPRRMLTSERCVE